MASFSASILCDLAEWEGAVADGDRCFKRRQRGNCIPRAAAQGKATGAATAPGIPQFSKVSVQAAGFPRSSTASVTSCQALHLDENDES